MMTIVSGTRVNSARRRNGVCTGRTRRDENMAQNALRAEVVWPDGRVMWPVVTKLTAASR